LSAGLLEEIPGSVSSLLSSGAGSGLAKLATWGTRQLSDGSRQTADAVLDTSAATIREYSPDALWLPGSRP
jgi:hypothetical protein